ncbi:MAG TPA: hypothetical protein VM557_12150 [Thermoanaerobaculia bacterium]|nr:hypothetical protein [Thermoanaerobaculia bacterium]
MPSRLLTLSLAAVVPLLASCTMTVRTPRAVVEPETVVLLSHGRSSSLVLPSADGRALRYAFGDWRFYALGRKGASDAAGALLWPTPAAFGRRETERGHDPMLGLAEHVGIAWDHAFPITVERSAVDALRARLESLFEARIETALFNPGPNLVFVRPLESYSIVNSSNQKVAVWLEELGCEVRGIRLLSRWRVETPAPAGPTSSL